MLSGFGSRASSDDAVARSRAPDANGRPMDVLGPLSARYCARQDAHAFMWLWCLALVLGAIACSIGKGSARLARGALLFFAAATGLVGASIFYGCYRWAPFSLGMGAPGLSARQLDTFMCLSQDAFGNSLGWTIVAVSCSAAAALIVWARSSAGSAGKRVSCSIGAALLMVVAVVVGLLMFVSFSWCLSRRLF